MAESTDKNASISGSISGTTSPVGVATEKDGPGTAASAIANSKESGDAILTSASLPGAIHVQPKGNLLKEEKSLVNYPVGRGSNHSQSKSVPQQDDSEKVSVGAQKIDGNNSAILREEKSRVNYPIGRGSSHSFGRDSNHSQSKSTRPQIDGETATLKEGKSLVHYPAGRPAPKDGTQRQPQEPQENTTLSSSNTSTARADSQVGASAVASASPLLREGKGLVNFPAICRDDRRNQKDPRLAPLPLTDIDDSHQTTTTPTSRGLPANDTETPWLSTKDEIDLKSQRELAVANRKSERELAVANLVREDSTPDLPMAEEIGMPAKTKDDLLQEEEQGFKRKRMIVSLLLLCLVVIVIVVTLVLVLGDSSASPERSGSLPPPSELASREEDELSWMPDYTVDAIANDPESPQKKAYDWLQQDPSLADYPDWRVKQRFALAAFYHATDGPSWTASDDWLSYEVHECDWYFWNGVNSLVLINQFDALQALADSNLEFRTPCEEDPKNISTNREGRFKLLSLFSNGLAGSLPLELYLLEDLKGFVTFNDKQLTGTIGSEVAQLTNLIGFGIAESSLSGSLPTEIGLLSNLLILAVANNQDREFGLTHTVPSEVGNLQELKYLSFAGNRLSGTLPAELGNLSKLTQMVFWVNDMTGAIPTTFGSMSRMVSLELAKNTFTGTLPSELGLLSALTKLDMNENELTGSPSSVLSLLTGLIHLDLYSNSLTGHIPTTFGRLSGIVTLRLATNEFIGPLPSQLGLLTGLTNLDLYSNSLTGQIPSTLGSMSVMANLALGKNEFTGTLPSELGLLNALTKLEANENRLTGPLPSELGLLTGLTNLRLFNNSLEGPLPMELCQLPQMEIRVDCLKVECPEECPCVCSD